MSLGRVNITIAVEVVVVMLSVFMLKSSVYAAFSNTCSLTTAIIIKYNSGISGDKINL